MAFTGIAAYLLPEGRTIHSCFKFGLEIDETTTSGFEAGTVAAKALAETDVFIIDEVSMVSRYLMEAIDRSLRQFTGKDTLFGGKTMLIGGDFRQTLPIKEDATPEQLVQLSLKGSELWKEFQVFKLTLNMRAGPDQLKFAEEILAIGEGRADDAEGKVKLPEECIVEGDLVKEIFGTRITDKDIRSLLNRAILAPTNKEVDAVNEKVLRLIKGKDESVYYSRDEIREQDSAKHKYVVELLNSINPSGIPAHQLRLRENAIVMLLRNLEVGSSLCNGTRLLVTHLSSRVLRCTILSGRKAGATVFIPRITLECTKGLPVPFYRKQFPVRLAFAMTINKSQGQTLDRVGLQLDRTQCFAHGQLYTGVSRVKDWDSLRVKLDEEDDGKCTNIVYRNVL
jgi:hypothetical protein